MSTHINSITVVDEMVTWSEYSLIVLRILDHQLSNGSWQISKLLSRSLRHILNMNLLLTPFSLLRHFTGVKIPRKELCSLLIGFSDLEAEWLLNSEGLVMREFQSLAVFTVFDMICRCGVRATLHHTIRARGINPIHLDPWYFPTANQYEKVKALYDEDP